MSVRVRPVLFAALIVLAACPTTAQQTPLTLVQTIALPGVNGRIDHLAFDPSSQRLFIAALGNNTVEVLDLKAATRIKSLSSFREPQGIAVARAANLVAVANGQGEGLQMFSADDFRRATEVALGEDSDNLRYEASADRLYVGFGNGALAAVSPTTGTILGKALLPGHPESFQLEQSGPRIFVNVPAVAQVVIVDRNAMKVTATWPLVGASSNFSMALDEADHRMFIGCRRPAKVLEYDISSGKAIDSFNIVGDTDDLFYDDRRKRLYVSGGNGYLDIFQDRGGRFVSIGHITTPTGARTSLFVPELDRLFLAVPHRGRQTAEIQVYEPR